MKSDQGIGEYVAFHFELMLQSFQVSGSVPEVADLADVEQMLERISVEMKARDEGLRQAFRIVTDALLRMQAVMDDIHAAATKEPAPSGILALLAEIKTILEAQPAQIARAVRDVLDART